MISSEFESEFKDKTGIYGGSFDPPGNHHVTIARRLTEIFDRVIIIPCGPRPDRQFSFNSPVLRAELATAAFADIPGVALDLSDIPLSRFTYTYDLDLKLRHHCQPVHIIGADLAMGGINSSSIVKSWHRGPEVWRDLDFLLLSRPGFTLQREDLPPHAKLIEVNVTGSGTAIREAYAHGLSIDDLVPKAVADLVRRTH